VRPDAADVDRVRRALGTTPVAWQTASGHGAPSNRRFVVDLEGGGSAFVKIAALDYTADWLREEHRVYEALDGLPFLPRLLGWDDDGSAPALVLEDLTGAVWPPPWNAARVDAVLATLDAVHTTPPPDGVPPAVESQFGLDGWPDVVADPQPFLVLELCSPRWLADHLPALADASSSAEIGGGSLLHFDVRSDNLCLRSDRAVLVDWNNTCVGNPVLDTAAWLPSLRAEGGPGPHEILSDEIPGLPQIASLLAGYFCARAGLPPIPQAPHARPLQLAQSKTSLPWAARLLGLPPPTPRPSPP
jgi:aminoglycoside phosphotransferase (APT) family kinase protein